MPSAGVQGTPTLNPLLGYKKYSSLGNPKVELKPIYKKSQGVDEIQNYTVARTREWPSEEKSILRELSTYECSSVVKCLGKQLSPQT
jgi:hypothetical protein